MVVFGIADFRYSGSFRSHFDSEHALVVAPVYISSRGRVQTILNALNMLKLRKPVVETDGIYRPAAGEMDVLICYANSIAHWEHSEP